MTNRSDGWASLQEQQYRNVLLFLGGGVYGSGDFNLEPIQLSNWAGNGYQEADLSFFSADPTHGNDKLDYTFYKNTHYCLLSEADEFNMAYTDHKALISFKSAC